MKRRHELPFGAELVPGGVRFRLWAPAAQRWRSLSMAAQLFCRWRPRPMAGSRSPRPRRGRARATAMSSTAVPCPIPRRASSPKACTARARSSTPLPTTGRRCGWRGRPWDEIVLYELHIGTFSESGDFRRRVRASRPSARARRDRGRVHAGRRLSRRSAIGAMTASCRSRPPPLWPAGGPEAACRGLPRARPRGLS